MTNEGNKTQISQDRQSTHKVILERLGITIVAVEKKYIYYILWVCVCSLRYPACKAHASYCHLWSVRLLQWKKYIYYILWVCVCSLRYPACKAHASYCHLWSVRLWNIFPYYHTKGTIFRKKLFNTKWVLIFSIALSETFWCSL